LLTHSASSLRNLANLKSANLKSANLKSANLKSANQQDGKSAAFALLAEFGNQKGDNFTDQGQTMIQHSWG